jgi:multidrug resistance protein, MATE family
MNKQDDVLNITNTIAEISKSQTITKDATNLNLNHDPLIETNTENLTSPGKTDTSMDSTKTENLKDIKFSYLIKKVSLVAFPGMMFYLFLILLQTLNLAFIGQKYNDDDMIKGIGVSNLYMNCTMFAIVMGLVSGIDTLCSNAYGIKKYKLMGLYVHRARIIGYAATVLIVIIHVFTIEKVLRLFNLNERVIDYSLKYIYVCLIYVFFDVQTACNFRFLNVIRKSHVNFIVLVIGGILHPLWNYIFIVYLDWDVIGAGISFTLSRLVICVCSTLYIHFWNPLPESNFCINRACFKGLLSYLKFSLAAAFLVCAEWWAFEIQAIIAISISEDDYTVHIIISQFASLLYSLCIGFSFSCTIIVGEFIAKSTTRITKKATYYTLIFGTFCMVILLGIFYLLDDYLFLMFINKENIIKKGMTVVPMLLLSEFFDLGQTIMCAVFRGLGKQASASILTFIQFYVIMTSLSFILGNTLKWGVYGMWVGITIGQVSAFGLYMILFLCMDLEKVQQEVKLRLDTDQKNAMSFIEIQAANENLLIDDDLTEETTRVRFMSYDKISDGRSKEVIQSNVF